MTDKPFPFSLPSRESAWSCPMCGGLGHAANASLTVGPDGAKFTPGTRCWLCLGKGRVRCLPLDDAEV